MIKLYNLTNRTSYKLENIKRKQMNKNTNSAVKGSALYIAGLLSTAGIVFMATESKEILGVVCLILSAGIYLGREYLLKK